MDTLNFALAYDDCGAGTLGDDADSRTRAVVLRPGGNLLRDSNRRAVLHALGGTERSGLTFIADDKVTIRQCQQKRFAKELTDEWLESNGKESLKQTMDSILQQQDS